MMVTKGEGHKPDFTQSIEEVANLKLYLAYSNRLTKVAPIS
jgi:hypothetical protein